MPDGVNVPRAYAFCSGVEVPKLADALETLLWTRVRAEEREREKAWKQWTNDSWTDAAGVVYRWIWGSCDIVLQMVRKHDAEYTTNVAEMNDVIRAAWRSMNRHYEMSPEYGVQH